MKTETDAASTKKPDVFPDLLKQLADGLSIQTKIASRYWLALALMSALVLIPSSQKDLPKLPFLSMQADARDFHAFAFVLISLLVLGYSSASCQGMRTRKLAQRYIDSSGQKFLSPGDIHIQDVFDSVVSPSINRLAPLVQILQGKQQFFAREGKRVSWGFRMLAVTYYGILRLVSLLVTYGLPGYAITTAFRKSDMLSPSAAIWSIPTPFFWSVGTIAAVVLLQSLLSDILFSALVIGRIWKAGRSQE